MLDTIRKILTMIEGAGRRKFVFLCGMAILSALSNFVGVAAIIPLLSLLARPDVIETNATMHRAYVLSGAADGHAFLVMVGVATFVVYLAGIATKLVASYHFTRFGQMRAHVIAVTILDGFLRQPYSWFLRRHTAELSNVLVNEVNSVVMRGILPLLAILSQGPMILALVVLVVVANPAIALTMSVGIGGSYVLIYTAVRKRLGLYARQRFQSDRIRSRIAQEALLGAKETKVLGIERAVLDRFDRSVYSGNIAIAKMSVMQEIPRYALEGLAFGSMILVLIVLLALEDGSLSAVLPLAGLYALAGLRIMPAMQTVYGAFLQLRFSRESIDSIHAELMSAAAIPPLPELPEPIRLRDGLRLRGVEFAYPEAERPTLRGISVDIAARTSVGIVGGTGAGKSTILDVILGLLEPTAGTVEVDGRPIATETDRRAWRRSIGYVPQHIFLVDDTVAANIAFGLQDSDVDPARVEEAARMAELHDFVMTELPQGYATLVGDRGIRLSGGQRQRVGIARALYHNPDILILDEATSALDNTTERAVMASVARLGGVKTILMVAHRLTTVRGCDEILFLEGGRIAARGSYDDLIDQNSRFREMALGAA